MYVNPLQDIPGLGVHDLELRKLTTASEAEKLLVRGLGDGDRVKHVVHDPDLLSRKLGRVVAYLQRDQLFGPVEAGNEKSNIKIYQA